MAKTHRLYSHYYQLPLVLRGYGAGDDVTLPVSLPICYVPSHGSWGLIIG
ncbi:hypothetical protein ACLB1M_03375 [Escherichia coli]